MWFFFSFWKLSCKRMFWSRHVRERVMFGKSINGTPQTVRGCSCIVVSCNTLLVFTSKTETRQRTSCGIPADFCQSGGAVQFLLDWAAATDLYLMFAIGLNCWYLDNKEWCHSQRTTSKQKQWPWGRRLLVLMSCLSAVKVKPPGNRTATELVRWKKFWHGHPSNTGRAEWLKEKYYFYTLVKSFCDRKQTGPLLGNNCSTPLWSRSVQHLECSPFWSGKMLFSKKALDGTCDVLNSCLGSLLDKVCVCGGGCNKY